MEIFITKNAGFCFGVKNAVDKVIEQANNGKKVFTYGPIIHNDTVVENLKKRGVEILTDLSMINENDTIIIRSHGISKEEYNTLALKNVEIIDATCSNVEQIHKIVEEKCNNGYKIVVIGDENHPEVKGINGWCGNNAAIIGSEEDMNKIPEYVNKICIVAQTTFNKDKWHSLTEKLIDRADEILIYNTICNATMQRQEEALSLSQQMDLMVIIGGKHSSNTSKLSEICSKNCKSVLIEDENEIDLNLLKDVNKIGIAAGTSTPDYIINNVIEKIKALSDGTALLVKETDTEKTVETEATEVTEATEATEATEVTEATEAISVKNTEETIEDMYSFYDNIYPGITIEGKIIQINDKELFVDIGYKADGMLPLEEASFEAINLKEKYKIGDTITIEVIKLNDGEGNVVLSRKAVEKEEYFNTLRKYKDEGTIIEVVVTGANKGGYTCQYGEISAFMPHSLSGIARGEDPESLVGKRIKVKINDIKEKRNEIELVLSRRDIINEQRQRKLKDFIAKVKCGEIYSGKVKSFINVGAFITVEDVDVFVPISEIAWKRINLPSDILKENQLVDILIIRVDTENNKITGSVKRTGIEPFEKFVLEYNEGDMVNGKVVRFTDFGAFIEITDGIDGLLHISNISEKHINKPQEAVKLGQMLKLKIIKIDKETKRISLSLKDVE